MNPAFNEVDFLAQRACESRAGKNEGNMIDICSGSNMSFHSQPLRDQTLTPLLILRALLYLK